MPQEIYSLAPLSPVGTSPSPSRDDINRMIAQLNLIFEAMGTQLGKLQARDSQQPQFFADLNLNGHRIVNVGPPLADGDAMNLGEVANHGLFSRRTGDPHTAPEVIVAAKGLRTPIAVQAGFAISFDQFANAVGQITGGDTSFGGDKTFGGSLSITGSFTLAKVTPAAIAANTNNYNPGTGSAFRISSTAPFNITGLTGGTDGRVVLLFNIGANIITLTNEDALSTAANRFHHSTGANVAMAADAAIALWYDTTTARWRDWSKR